jgi:hypothetical protein
MAKLRNTFDLVTDASHGWLKVPVAELERLNIVEDITTHSYVRNDMAYLEQDVDLGQFLVAREAEGNPVKRIKEHNRNGQGRIRKYAMFGGDRMITKTNLLSGVEFEQRADTPRACDPSTELYHSM